MGVAASGCSGGASERRPGDPLPKSSSGSAWPRAASVAEATASEASSSSAAGRSIVGGMGSSAADRKPCGGQVASSAPARPGACSMI